jgi:hypothetical protein
MNKSGEMTWEAWMNTGRIFPRLRSTATDIFSSIAFSPDWSWRPMWRNVIQMWLWAFYQAMSWCNASVPPLYSMMYSSSLRTIFAERENVIKSERAARNRDSVFWFQYDSTNYRQFHGPFCGCGGAWGRTASATKVTCLVDDGIVHSSWPAPWAKSSFFVVGVCLKNKSSSVLLNHF